MLPPRTRFPSRATIRRFAIDAILDDYLSAPTASGHAPGPQRLAGGD
jgi:hypothetical protein